MYIFGEYRSGVGIDQSIPMIYTLPLLDVKTKKEIVGDGRVLPNNMGRWPSMARRN